jgi:energy-coupling factor transporter ATP-binding protein EcfA2
VFSNILNTVDNIIVICLKLEQEVFMQEEKQNVKILSIYISELFGYKEINIDISKNENLVVLYGDNGSGKTTVLNLIYHLFSPEPTKGHRTYIEDIIFKSLFILLSNKIEIILEREKANSRPYNIIIKKADEVIISWKWFPQDHPEYIDIRKQEEYKKYCQLMEKLNFNIFYVPANRRTDEDDSDKDEEIIIQNSNGTRLRTTLKNNKISLTKTLRQFQQWLRQEIIKRTNIGYRSINDFYNEMIKGVIQNKETSEDLFQKEYILGRISDIESKNNEYKKYGLSEDFLKDDILEILKETTENNIVRQIATVLNPYLDSINLRLQSLAELQLLLSKFELNINHLFSEKKLILNIEDGIVIESHNNKIDPQKLSSGEKQLLLIFCNVITSCSNSQLIIIDEPEISLNVKWQRKFISSILDIIDRKSTHLFIATHSIEMINKYQDNIHQLGGKNECPS